MSKGAFSLDRLGRMYDRLSGYVERGELPGLVTLVYRKGEVHVDAIGRDGAFLDFWTTAYQAIED
ncbi:hypothetical protein QIH01_04940 [Brevibacillus brevis]|nr:hypothetical protein QIH01_04940 [Brevibacillus brevis]